MKFTELYKQLNKEQKLAVDSIEGPVMVIAGPGTGKTQVLTLRIANILQKTDIPAEAILAVTFTEAGVVAMRKRLAEIVGSRAYEPMITTFHGFAQNVIQHYPESFPRIIGSISISEADQVRIMEELLEETRGIKILRPFGDRMHYLRDILHAIQILKREGVSVKDFEKIADQAEAKKKSEEKMIEKNRELAILYEAYQDKLTEEKLYDFDDMIAEVLGALMTNDELRMILQEQYQYVLVDEHQDTNNAQNRILELLMSYHDNPNLFIVGDEKQAIFRFQGASLENFNYFKNKFKKAKLITLTENYRSTQHILDAVHTKLQSQSKTGKPIQLIEAETSDSELYIIAKLIKPDENSAVLYRDNRDVIPLARMFDKLGIPYHIESDLDILSDFDIKKLMLIFRSVESYDPTVLYLDLWGFDAFEAEKHALEIQQKLSKWKTVAYNKSLLDFFDTVVEESGLLKSILARPDAVEAIEKLSVLLDQIRKMLEVKPDSTLRDFLAHLDRMDRHRLSIKGALAGSHPGKVRLMTAHRSKGLEFDCVYIINAYDGHWGNRRRVKKLEPLPETNADDDRNLFYVAVTRAKKEVTISYAKLSLDQREQLPSQFIGELKQELLEKFDVSKLENEFKRHREVVFAPSQRKPDLEDWVGELFKKRGFAVTHLNNYIECPWKYFFVNLLRIPKAPESAQMYGTAMHAALRTIAPASAPPLTGKRGLGGDSARARLLSEFKTHLTSQPMSDRDKKEYLERGVKALGEYYDKYHSTWTNPILSEYKVSIEHDGILLTGNIDKIELLDNQNVIVTDYKTGKPKSRNEIMGKTRTADPSYYRQLVFYNLLLNENGKYTMKEGEIDFVEHGRQERFEITQHETRNMEQEIKRVADEILNLGFWDKNCEKKDCQWCGLRGMMG